jgi:hypothetical protein
VAERVPPDLLSRIRADVGPVRPLAPPWRRALWLAPLGAGLVLAVPVVWGRRADMGLLGGGVGWLLSGLQALAGLWVLGAALREAVPGRSLSRRALAATACGALGLLLGVTVVTALASPHPVPPGVFLRFAWECYGIAALSGLPLLAAAGWLVSRALPTRPALTGALYGLGAGLVSDAGMRLFCWVSDPLHVLVSHGGAVLTFMALGAAAAAALDRVRGAP